LAEGWNGISWSIAPAAVPPQGNGLNQRSLLSGVACYSAIACAAVGTYTGLGTAANGQTLAEYWNGTAWYMSNAGSPYWNMTSFSGGGSLSGVSCPTVASCNAAGQANHAALAEVYEGMTTWMVQLPAAPTGATSSTLYGVSCPGLMECTSVGKYINSSGVDQALVERLTG
jgi:hypothetical protein